MRGHDISAHPDTDRTLALTAQAAFESD